MFGLNSVSASNCPGLGSSMFIITFGWRGGGGAIFMSEGLLRNLPGESLPDLWNTSMRFPRLLRLELPAELIIILT